MDAAPTEYLWQYNPVTGRVGGANQNYGERINILHSNRYLYNRMQDVQRAKNQSITKKGIKSLTGGSYAHFMPAEYKTSDDHDCLVGVGASISTLDSNDQTSTDQLKRLADIALEAEENKKKENSSLTTCKFVRNFPPVVYEHPFSGSNFAYEFNPFYNPDGNEFSNSTTFPEDGAVGGAISYTDYYPELHGGSISYTGDYPKLHGGAVTLAGENPILGGTSFKM